MLIISVVRGLAEDQLVQHHSYLVNVTSLAESFLRNHLGSEVGRRTAEGMSPLASGNTHLRQAEVDELAVALTVNDYVGRLEITVDDVL